jgi:hypothetical protein
MASLYYSPALISYWCSLDTFPLSRTVQNLLASNSAASCQHRHADDLLTKVSFWCSIHLSFISRATRKLWTIFDWCMMADAQNRYLGACWKGTIRDFPTPILWGVRWNFLLSLNYCSKVSRVYSVVKLGLLEYFRLPNVVSNQCHLKFKAHPWLKPHRLSHRTCKSVNPVCRGTVEQVNYY